MRPINRLEPWLTRDYIDRAAKMRSFEGKPWRPFMTKKDLVSCWMVFLAICALVAWVVENN